MAKYEINTQLGTIVIELLVNDAPRTCENFTKYAENKFYDGTIFHRVINGFVIQGGGLTEDMQAKETRDPIKNESENGISNQRATVAMARTNQPDSATSQFYINLVNNDFLDYKEENGTVQHGYTVFAKVIKGMDIVDRIAKEKTNPDDAPINPIRIESVTAVNHSPAPVAPVA